MDPKLNVFPFPKKLFVVFQIFGLFPLSLEPSKPAYDFLQRCITLLHCISLVAIFTCCLVYASIIFYTKYAIGLFVDMLQTLGPILAHLIILIEASRRVRSYRLFWQQLRETFWLVQELQGPQIKNLRVLYFKSTLKFLVFFWIPLIIELTILWGIRKNYWIYTRLAVQMSLFACRLSILQLCLHLQMIKWILQQVEEETRIISNESKSQLKSLAFEMRRGIILRRIQVIHKITSAVMVLTSHLNHCFNWSLLANLLHNFFSITVALYWNYRALQFKNRNNKAESLMCSPPLIITLCFLMFSCQDAFKPLTQIVFHLNRIRRHPKNFPLHHGIQLVLLQLLHRPLEISAMRFLGLNFASLKDFTVAMFKYLVIFIQFMPRDLGLKY